MLSWQQDWNVQACVSLVDPWGSVCWFCACCLTSAGQSVTSKAIRWSCTLTKLVRITTPRKPITITLCQSADLKRWVCTIQYYLALLVGLFMTLWCNTSHYDLLLVWVCHLVDDWCVCRSIIKPWVWERCWMETVWLSLFTTSASRKTQSDRRYANSLSRRKR